MHAVRSSSGFQVKFAGVLLVLALPIAAVAGTAPEQKCEAGMNQEAGKYAACIAKAEKGLVATEDAGKYALALTKCEDKLAAKWSKLEAGAVAQGTLCPSVGDQTPIEGFLDACGQSVAAALAGGTLGPDPVTCAADLDTCQIDLAACGAPGLYSISFTVTDSNPLGALQILTDYSAAPGEFVGSGASVSCARTFGNISAHNDDDGLEALNSVWIAPSGGTGPMLMTVCDFAATEVPVAGDFNVAVVDATDPGASPTTATIGVTVARKL